MFDELKWETAIRRYNFKENVEGVMSELMMRVQNIGEEFEPNENDMPYTCNFIETVVKPRIQEYAIHHLEPRAVVTKYNIFCNKNTNGSGIIYHQHSSSHISSVFYVIIQHGSIVFHDPKQQASRGYPLEVRKGSHFKNQVIEQCDGDLVIFPSYLYHSVDSHSPGLRIALVMDFWIDVEE